MALGPTDPAERAWYARDVRGLFAATALVAGVVGMQTARAAEPPPAPVRAAVLVAADGDDAAAGDTIGRALLARRAPAERVAAPAVPEPSPEAEVADVRALYAQMRFPQAIARVAAHTEALIAGQLPDAQRVRALAELMRWDGALRLLGGDGAAAAERFALAARLEPGTAPDRIFPPEVAQAWRAATRSEAPSVTVAVRVAPADARIWIDGKLVGSGGGAPITTAIGLHYVVVERADKRPVARLVRVTREAPEITAQLSTAARGDEALRQATARLAAGADFSSSEASGLAAALGRPLWIVRARAGGWRAERHPAPNEARAVVTLPAAPDVEAMARAVAETEEALRAAPAPVAERPRDRRPVWKRGWFWGVLGASVVVAAGAAAGAAVAATSPRDYVVQVR
jgi:hypothetical protein